MPDVDSAARDARIHRALVTWYRAHARNLPWRRTRDPYRIWLSEVMLQQTRVETVVPYFERWLARFPDVATLAAASEDDVLKLWEGLGYYRRARALHRAAQQVAEGGGRLPDTAAAWQRLPGIGPYTANAIASIALGEAVPVVDGNVERVLARLERIETTIDERETKALFWRRAGELLAAGRSDEAFDPGAFNQATMELGATVCVPRQPACLLCPLREDCRALRSGMAEALPVMRAKRAVPHADWAAALIVRGGRYLLAQRPPGLLGGLWELPSTTVGEDESQESALVRMLRDDLGLVGELGAEVATVDHAFTHLRVTIRLSRMRASGSPVANRHVACRWVSKLELAGLALPVAMRKLAAAAGL